MDIGHGTGLVDSIYTYLFYSKHNLVRNDPYYRDVVKLSLWAPTIFIGFIGLLFSCIIM